MEYETRQEEICVNAWKMLSLYSKTGWWSIGLLLLEIVADVLSPTIVVAVLSLSIVARFSRGEQLEVCLLHSSQRV